MASTVVPHGSLHRIGDSVELPEERLYRLGFEVCLAFDGLVEVSDVGIEVRDKLLRPLSKWFVRPTLRSKLLIAAAKSPAMESPRKPTGK